MDTLTIRKDRRASANKVFVKLGVQWLIEVSTSHKHLWYIDSLSLRNPQLHKPPKTLAASVTVDTTTIKLTEIIETTGRHINLTTDFF